MPYSALPQEFQLFYAFAQGTLPASEDHLKQPVDIWPIVQGCWQMESQQQRTVAALALKELRLLVREPISLSLVRKRIFR